MTKTVHWGRWLLCLCLAAPELLAMERLNILVIWGDDIGYWNISAYNLGQMGYKTPILTVLPTKAPSSPIITDSKAAPPVVPRLSRGNHPFARG